MSDRRGVLLALLCGVAAVACASDTRRAAPAATTAPRAPPTAPATPAAPPARATAATPADRIVELLNEHRARAGLPAVAKSRSLTLVAETHVRDLERSPPAGACNSHSWSAGGEWTACCYTADHAQARCMWDKPRELTKGTYPGAGFEIAAWFSGRITAEQAVEMWQKSPAHWQVVMSEGMWRARGWKAIGAAVSAHHAVVWFGHEPE